MPDHESCVDDCGYCLAKDNKTKIWECVNCKTRYGVEKYNLNGTCYDTIPKIEYDDPDVKGKDHHIIDDQCNLLIGCKEGCKNCFEWYTEKCTSCFPNFFKNDTTDKCIPGPGKYYSPIKSIGDGSPKYTIRHVDKIVKIQNYYLSI